MPLKTFDEWRKEAAKLPLRHTHIVWVVLAAWYWEQQQKPIKTLDECREEVANLHLPPTHMAWAILDDWAWEQQTRTGAPLTPANPLYADAETSAALFREPPRAPGAPERPGLFLRFTLPKGTLLLLTPTEYAQGLYRGKMERRANRMRLYREGERP
jgi:hypothetical protein